MEDMLLVYGRGQATPAPSYACGYLARTALHHHIDLVFPDMVSGLSCASVAHVGDDGRLCWRAQTDSTLVLQSDATGQLNYPGPESPFSSRNVPFVCWPKAVNTALLSTQLNDGWFNKL